MYKYTNLLNESYWPPITSAHYATNTHHPQPHSTTTYNQPRNPSNCYCKHVNPISQTVDIRAQKMHSSSTTN
jgi:hypothetical protein